VNLLQKLWKDEDGVILSAEAAVLGTVAVIGVTAGLSSLTTSVNKELHEVGSAMRSLDQSYHVPGQVSEHASTAGSIYVQPAVVEIGDESHSDAASGRKARRKRRQNH